MKAREIVECVAWMSVVCAFLLIWDVADILSDRRK